MNICFLLGGFKVNGGIGRVVSILANKLSDDRNIQVFTLSFFDNGQPNLYTLSNKIKQDYLFNNPITMRKALCTTGIFKMREYINKNKIDIVVACGDLYFPLAILSRKKNKVICWEHANLTVTTDHKLQGYSRLFGTKFSDYSVVLTKEDLNNYSEKYKIENLLQIYNPVDPQLEKNIFKYNIDSKKIISVGRLNYQKNIPLMIEIAENVLNTNVGWTWDLYGDGDQHDNIVKLIKEKRLQDRFNLKGQVYDLYDKYKEYSFFVMTSRYEGFPMTLLEASSNGLPLVSFDIPTGPKEIIENNKNGYLIEGNNKQDMINKINLLIREHEIRLKMSKKSYELSKKFGIEEIEKDWKILFQRLMEK